MTVAGASRFLVTARLANTQGISPAASSVLGASGTADLVQSAKGAQRRFLGEDYIGLSASARALNARSINNPATLFNSIGTSTTETAVAQINALRSSVPEDRLSSLVRANLEAERELENTITTQEILDIATNTVFERLGDRGVARQEIDDAIAEEADRLLRQFSEIEELTIVGVDVEA